MRPQLGQKNSSSFEQQHARQTLYLKMRFNNGLAMRLREVGWLEHRIVPNLSG